MKKDYRRRIVFAWLSAFVVIGFTCHVQAAEDDYKRMPWHLADLWWDLGETRSFESYSIDVAISATPADGVNLYIAPIGLGKLNGVSFYGGIQTNCDGNTKADRRLKKLGPGFLFSMWGERSITAIRPADGGYWQSSGHEGDFVSVRRPFRWKAGKYTYRLVRMDEEEVDDKRCTWVGAFIYSHTSDENLFVGALRFPTHELKLDRKIASFVEIYGRQKPVTEIPKLEVVFGTLKVNGKPVAVSSVDAYYPDGVPDYAAASARGDDVRITLGEPVLDRSKRRERLMAR